MRATVAQNWRSVGLEVQVTGNYNRAPESADGREKLKKKESEPTYTWHLKRIHKTRCVDVVFQKQQKSWTGMAFRDEDMDRMALEDIETPWTISVLFDTTILLIFVSWLFLWGVLNCWSGGRESTFIEPNGRARSFTTGLPFLIILNLVNNMICKNRNGAKWMS